MPLRDHFRPPVSNLRHWSEFHGWWPAEIARTLFDALPPGYQVGPRVSLGSSFEVDVSVAEENRRAAATDDHGDGGVATLAAVETPYTVVADTLNFDEYEVRIYDAERERTLVAAIEIVSPSNKDRPETRTLFVSKCAALLREGVCVSIVDIVSERLANLYADLVSRIGQPDPRVGADPSAMYAATLRIRRQGRKQSLLDLWYYPLAVGQALPTIPIWLRPDLRVVLPLEPSYQEVCRLLRIP